MGFVGPTLIITPDFPPTNGGIQTMLYNIAAELACKTGVVVVAPEVESAAGFDRAQPFKIIRLKFPKYKPDGFWTSLMTPAYLRHRPRTAYFNTLRLAMLPEIEKIIKAEQIINIQCGHICLMETADEAARDFKLKYIVYTYGQEIEFVLNSPRKNDVEYLSEYFRHCEKIITISEYTRALVARAFTPSEKILKVPLGVSEDLMVPANGERIRKDLNIEGKCVILTVGRLVRRKGHENVIRALPALIKKNDKVCYLIVGEGEYCAELEKLAAELHITDYVHFAGNVPGNELPEYYAACDVFAMASNDEPAKGLVEGFGLVYLEAAAQGKPVVGHRSGGVPDAILHGQTGLLVDLGDGNALVDALTKLLSDKEYANRLGEQGKARVRNEMNWKKTGEQITAILENIGEE